MRRLLLAAALVLPFAAQAQSLPFPISPTQGQTVWTPAQWVTAWTGKADVASLPTSSNFNFQFPTSGTPVGGQNSGVMVPFSMDNAGNLLVNIAAGQSAGGTASTFSSAFPSSGTAMGAKNGPNMVPVMADAAGNLQVNLQTALPAGTNSIGSVTANAGTNLNTSALALETGGNLAAVAGAVLSQTTAISGAKGYMALGAVTTSAPSYTTAQLDPLSLDTAGNLRINCITGCSSSGGSSVADNGVYTEGTTSMTVMGGEYNTSPGNLTSGHAGAAQLTIDRMLYVNLGKVGGTATVSGGVNGSVSVGGPTASGSSIAANPVTVGARAQSAEATAVTNGQVVNLAASLTGKLITLPFANKENNLSGASTGITSATNTSLIAAAGSGVKIYLTGFSCANTGATTSLIQFTSGSGGTVLWSTINPAGAGTNGQINPPVATAANTALFFTTGSASTSQFCSVTGFSGT
jgi:hypothetical protein